MIRWTEIYRDVSLNENRPEMGKLNKKFTHKKSKKMGKLKTWFLVVLVGMIVIGAIASYVGADYAFCKYHNSGSSIGSYCDAYTDCGNGYCINNIACDDWMSNQQISFCIYGETYYYFGFNC